MARELKSWLTAHGAEIRAVNESGLCNDRLLQDIHQNSVPFGGVPGCLLLQSSAHLVDVTCQRRRRQLLLSIVWWKYL
jgi:hypothetical protein